MQQIESRTARFFTKVSTRNISTNDHTFWLHCIALFIWLVDRLLFRCESSSYGTSNHPLSLIRLHWWSSKTDKLPVGNPSSVRMNPNNCLQFFYLVQCHLCIYDLYILTLTCRSNLQNQGLLIEICKFDL